MTVHEIAGYQYGMPERAGEGLGYELLRKLSELYRMDFPGPRKLDPSEFISFIEWAIPNLATVDAQKIFWTVCLEPLHGAPSVDYLYKIVSKEEMLAISNHIATLVNPILAEDKLFEFIQSVFIANLSYGTVPELDTAIAEGIAEGIVEVEIGSTELQPVEAEPPKRKRKK